LEDGSRQIELGGTMERDEGATESSEDFFFSIRLAIVDVLLGSGIDMQSPAA